MLLQNRDATVTVVHSRTPDAEKICAGGLRVWGMCGEGWVFIATVTVVHFRTPDAEKICTGGLRVWGMCEEGGFSLPPSPLCTLARPMRRTSAQVG